jgi:hypothetical protein
MKQNVSVVSSHSFCRFCGYFSVKKSRINIDVPLTSNEHYSALVSIGALVHGWSLVCPIEHEINLSNHYKNAEFWSFLKVVVDTIKFRYGDVRLFEHGAYTQDSVTGCGTWHAHLHVVPLNFSLIQEAMKFDTDRKWYSCAASDISNFSNGQEYLFVADEFNKDRTIGLISLLDEGVSQFFRKVIANRLGLNEFYDYRLFPMLDIAEQSASQLRTDFSGLQLIASKR